MTLLAFLSIACLVSFAYCAFKESEITAKYQTFGVYGRFKAYLFLDMAAAGVVFILGAFIFPILQSKIDMLVWFVFGAICVAIAFYIFHSAKSKCPEGPLRDKFLISMVITGVGVAVKIILFFVSTIWDVIGPKIMVNEDGKTIYVFNDGDVYDGAGNIIGKMTGSNEYIEFKKR